MNMIVSRESLRVLMLEDHAGDAALIQRALAVMLPHATVRWAKNRPEFIHELADFAPQLVLSDYKLPDIDGLAALALVRAGLPDLPFILISGTIGEDTAVEALKSGVTDYVMKNRLERLSVVLTRALHERRESEDLAKAEAELLVTREKLLHSQKMESLGRLSGGIAHDFNNILTAITGYSELALMDTKLEEGLRSDIQEILNAAFRAAALTRQLLAFSRRQIFSPKILDLNRSLAELDRMLQRIIGEDVKLSVVTDPGIGRIRVDADQIGQVILNLVVNARDAMPKGGTITLRTANVELDSAALAAQPDVPPGRFVRLSVEDSGVGMEAATLALIFEPFFTTKGSGTGLGLATVYGIVKQSNGFIDVESTLGRGTVFEVYLPCVAGDLDAVRSFPAPESLKGCETILIVDDDAAVGLISRRVLEVQGYTVIAAQGGEEAWRLFRGSPKPVDLVLTDVVMAGMSGPELAKLITAERPACRVLFVSGYAEGGITEFAAVKEHFIQAVHRRRLGQESAADPRLSCAIGSLTVNSVLPGRLSTEISPPCLRTISPTRLSPRPVP
jgi:two-component system cell cycle sensor histidine kinase/response regulator CckA